MLSQIDSHLAAIAEQAAKKARESGNSNAARLYHDEERATRGLREMFLVGIARIANWCASQALITNPDAIKLLVRDAALAAQSTGPARIGKDTAKRFRDTRTERGPSFEDPSFYYSGLVARLDPNLFASLGYQNGDKVTFTRATEINQRFPLVAGTNGSQIVVGGQGYPVADVVHAVTIRQGEKNGAALIPLHKQGELRFVEIRDIESLKKILGIEKLKMAEFVEKREIITPVPFPPILLGGMPYTIDALEKVLQEARPQAKFIEPIPDVPGMEPGKRPKFSREDIEIALRNAKDRSAMVSDVGGRQSPDEDSIVSIGPSGQLQYSFAGNAFEVQYPRNQRPVLKDGIDIISRDLDENDAFLVACEMLVAQGVRVDSLCDGMGGASAGEIASQKANQYFIRGLAFFRHWNDMNADQKANATREAVIYANRMVYMDRHPGREKPDINMGSTIVARVTVGTDTVITNIGDSRAYMQYPDGVTERVTKDHSVAWGVHGGDDDKIRVDPGRNYILRNVGDEEEIDHTYMGCHVMQLDGRSQVLLCCDGLWEAIPYEQIRDTIWQRKSTPDRGAAELIRLANEAKIDDNVSVVVS